MKTYNQYYNERIEYGLNKEDELYPILKNQFDETLTKSTDKYDKFDYYGDKYVIELKSRRIPHNKYNTTLINKHKCDYANEKLKDKVVIFCFHFIDDKILYIQYNKDLFDTFEIQHTISHQYKGERINYEIPLDLMSIISV